MKPPVWLDDHIYAAPTARRSTPISSVPARPLTACHLLDELPKTHDINALRHLLRAIRACWREVRRLEWNCQTYGYNRLSRDGRDEAARVLLSRGQQLQANLSQLCKPVTLFWVRAPEELVRALLQDPELFELAYAIRHDRRQQDQWLSLESEQLIAGLSVDGLQGWGISTTTW